MLLPSALIVGVVLGVSYIRGVEVLDGLSRSRVLNVAGFMAIASEQGVVAADRQELDVLIRGMRYTEGRARLAILDRDCNILAQTRDLAAFDAMRAEICTTTTSAILEDSVERLVVAEPVRFRSHAPGFESGAAAPDAEAEGRIAGWVYLEVDMSLREERRRQALLVALGLVLAGLALAALSAIWLARAMSRPIRRMAAAVRRMQEGDLGVRIEDEAFSTELAALEQGFNAMAESIARHHGELQARIDAATAQLSWQANHDPLTGLGNRRRYEQALDELMSYSQRSGDHGALCLIDLDHFKAVNDSCGHPAGDELLRNIADIIRARLREDDLVCRIGGDEFAVILKNCSMAKAHELAESIRAHVAAYRIACGGREFSVGTSIGLAPVEGDAHSRLEVVVAADQACYEAKKAGRNRIVEGNLPPPAQGRTS